MLNFFNISLFFLWFQLSSAMSEEASSNLYDILFYSLSYQDFSVVDQFLSLWVFPGVQKTLAIYSFVRMKHLMTDLGSWFGLPLPSNV